MTGRELAALLSAEAPRHGVREAAVGLLCDGATTTACYGDGVTADTRFLVGSLTKPMVATVLARFASAGRLSLDDPASVRVPELRGCDWAERSTLRDLLANRSGLPLSAALEFGFESRREEDDGALARFAAEVAAATPTPGIWSYSNAGWSLLGRAVETAADATWEEAMRAELATTLPDATFASADGLPGRAYAPAGTRVASTIADLLRFAALHLDDPSLAVLREVHAETAIHGWLDAWCLGWARFDWPGGPVWGWDGVIGGARTVLRLVPEQRGAVAFAANDGAGRALYRAVLPHVMADAFGITQPPLRLEPTLGAGNLSRFAGVYAWPDEQVVVTATEDGLVVTSADGEQHARPLDGRTVVVDAADPDTPTISFGAFDAAGRPHVLYVMIWGFPRVGA